MGLKIFNLASIDSGGRFWKITVNSIPNLQHASIETAASNEAEAWMATLMLFFFLMFFLRIKEKFSTKLNNWE